MAGRRKGGVAADGDAVRVEATAARMEATTDAEVEEEEEEEEEEEGERARGARRLWRRVPRALEVEEGVEGSTAMAELDRSASSFTWPWASQSDMHRAASAAWRAPCLARTAPSSFHPRQPEGARERAVSADERARE